MLPIRTELLFSKKDICWLSAIFILFALLIGGSLYYNGYAMIKISRLESQILKLNDDLTDQLKRDLVLRSEIDRLERIISDVFTIDFRKEMPVFAKTVRVTAYTARPAETDSTPETTASGNPSRVGAIAVSRDLEAIGIDVGDLVILQGLGLFKVEDRTGVWKRKNTQNPVPVENTVDILHANLAAARLFGVQSATIIWIGKHNQGAS